MTKTVKRGGMVQIGGMDYFATEAPVRAGNRYLLPLFSPAHQKAYLAEAEGWRGGRGPWKLLDHSARLPNKPGEPQGLCDDGFCDDHGAFGCKRCIEAFEAHAVAGNDRPTSHSDTGEQS